MNVDSYRNLIERRDRNRDYMVELMESNFLRQLHMGIFTRQEYISRLTYAYKLKSCAPSDDYLKVVKELALENSIFVYTTVDQRYLDRVCEFIKQDYLEGKMTNVGYRQWASRKTQIEFDRDMGVAMEGYDKANRLPRVSPNERKANLEKEKIDALKGINKQLDNLNTRVDKLGQLERVVNRQGVETWVSRLALHMDPDELARYHLQQSTMYGARSGRLRSYGEPTINQYREELGLQTIHQGRDIDIGKKLNDSLREYFDNKEKEEVKEVVKELPKPKVVDDEDSSKNAILMTASLICATIITIAALML